MQDGDLNCIRDKPEDTSGKLEKFQEGLWTGQQYQSNIVFLFLVIVLGLCKILTLGGAKGGQGVSGT